MTTPGTQEALDLAALKERVIAVSGLGLSSKAAALKRVVPEIDALTKAGYSLTAIMNTVNEGGIAFDSISSFKTTLYRLRDKGSAQ